LVCLTRLAFFESGEVESLECLSVYTLEVEMVKLHACPDDHNSMRIGGVHSSAAFRVAYVALAFLFDGTMLYKGMFSELL
jgi:hypothetical protein